MNWHKIWLILSYEYMTNLRRKSFLFTAFILPLIIAGAMVISISLTEESATNLDDYKRVGYVDPVKALAEVNDPDGEFERFIPFESAEDARAAYDTGDITAYFVLPGDYWQTGRVEYFSSKTPIPVLLQKEFESFLTAGIASQAPAGSPVERLTEPLLTEIQVVGDDKPIDEEVAVARFLVPMIFVVLFGITVLTTAQFLMSGVIEEKENRISEILLSSARASELMIGKMLGLGALALTQVFYMLALGLVGGLYSGRLDMIAEMNFKLTDLVIMLVYFLLSFTLFAGTMLGVGAAVSAESESRQFAVIFNLLFISPIYFVVVFMENPDGTFATALSLIPFTSPMTILFLLAIGALRTWQIIASLLVQIITIAIMIWMVSKIFRRGILMYDQRLSFKQLRAILRRS